MSLLTLLRSEPAAAGDVSLQAILASCVFDMDATIESCYAGTGQTFANICEVPADGSGTSDSNLFLGASVAETTDDPAFTGTAGDSGAYFAMDGGDFFELQLGAATQPDFFKNLARTDQLSGWALAFAIKTPAALGTTYLFDQATANANNVGLTVRFLSGGRVDVFQSKGSSPQASYIGSNGMVTADTDTLIIITHNKSTNSLVAYINGTKTTGTLTFNTCAADPSLDTVFMALNTGSTPAPNGTRVYAVSGFASFFSDEDAAALKAAYDARHGRTYL